MTTNEQAGGEYRDIDHAKTALKLAITAGEDYYADYWRDEIKRLERGTVSAALDLSQFEGMTEGPWDVCCEDGVEKVRQPLHTIWSKGKDGALDVLVARTCYLPRSDANARAIAAVPALIAEVKRLMEDVERLNGEAAKRLRDGDEARKAMLAAIETVHAQKKRIAEIERDRERLSAKASQLGSQLTTIREMAEQAGLVIDPVFRAAMQTNPEP